MGLLNIAKVQVDYGIIYKDFGETTEELLGPIRGGGEFNASKNIKDIEFDGNAGKTKGAQFVDEINAFLKLVSLNASMDMLKTAMPFATLSAEGVLICSRDNLGLIPNDAYWKNITMFCKTLEKKYKKITIYNPMNESDFNFAAKPKSEGEISLEMQAHWSLDDDPALDVLFRIEDVDSIKPVA